MIKDGSGQSHFGVGVVGVNRSIDLASFKAMLCPMNRSHEIRDRLK